MFCPNFLNKDVFDGFNEMIEALGGKPMTAEEFRSSELRNLRTGPDFAAMETAYKLYHLNGGNFLDFAPNGEPSLLFASILAKVGSYKEAIAVKANFYSKSFTEKNGDWFVDTSDIKKIVQDNGKIRLSLPSDTKDRPRQLVIEPQGDNKYYIHVRTWNGDHIPAELTNEEKNKLYEALYEELPGGAEILFPESGENYYATRGTVASLIRLSRDPRFKNGKKGSLLYKDKDGEIKTYEGTSFIKIRDFESFKFDINGEPILEEFVNNQGVRFDVQKEMDKIKAEAIANGTFMKAPNGKPTNLTEKQWLQVRTKAFKEWFGDWLRLYRSLKLTQFVFKNFFDENKNNDTIGEFIKKVETITTESKKANLAISILKQLVSDIDVSAIRISKQDLSIYDRMMGRKGTLAINFKDTGLVAYDDKLEVKNKEYVAIAVCHEIIHQITVSKYNSDKFFKEKVDNLYDYVLTQAKHKNLNLEAYGLTSPLEMLAEIVNPQFQDVLSNIPSRKPGESIFKEIVNLLKSIFKINTNERTSFDDLLELIKENHESVFNSNSVSKVVDENGEPLVVYHGTQSKWNVFNPEKIGSATDDGYYGKGLYLSSLKSKADEYNIGGNGQTMPLFVNIKNPFYVGLDKHLDLDEATRRGEIVDKFNREDLPDELKLYDGVLYTGGDARYEEVVIKDPNQIKSATDNNGGFSTENDDINAYPNISSELNVTEEEKKATKKYGFDVKFKPVSSTDTFGEYIARRLESGQTVSSSEIVKLFTEKNYFSESNKTLAEMVARHDIPVIFAPLDGAIMTTRTDKNGGSYVIIDLTNLQNVSNNFFSDKFLHEVVHALSVGTINNPKSSKERALVLLNRSLFDTFSKLFPKEKYSRSTYLYYGLTNEKEFLAEFITNSEFRDALYAKTVELQSKGILNKIKSFINRISNLFINRDIFKNETKEQLKKLESDFKKYLLNIETVEKGNITDEAVLNALYNNIDDETSFNDLVAIAQDQLARSIENWDSNNFLLLPVTPTSGVNRIKTEQEVKREIEKKSKEIAESLSKRLAAILSSNLSADEKLKHQLQLLAQITQFRDYSENFYKNLTMFIIPLSAQLLEDSKRISRIRINLATISDSEYMYQAHANFGVYRKILEELKNLFDEPSTLTILQSEIQNDPLGNNDVKNNIEMLMKRIEESALVANSALAKTKKILISNLKQKFSDYAAKYNFIDLVDYIDELEDINYDTNKFFNLVGSMDAAKDPGLRMLHTLVYNAINVADRQTHEKSTKLLNLQKNLKHGESVKDLYEHNRLGLTTGYLIRRYNYGQMYQDYDDFLKKLNAECGLDLDNRIAPNDDNTRKIWNQKRNKWLSEHVERKYKPEYYEIFSNLSYETLKARSQVQNEINVIKEKCKNKDGYYHFEDLSDKDWETLQSLYTTRRWLASEFRIDGTKKDGVELKIAQELQALNKALGEHRSINKDIERWKKDRAKIIEKAGGMKKFKDQSDDFNWDMLAKWDERNSVTRLKINDETGRSVLAEFIDDQIDYDIIYELIDEDHPNGDNGETYENLKKDYYKLLNTARTSSGDINPFNLSEGAKKKILEIASEMAKIKKQAKKNNKLLRDVLKRKARLWKKYAYSEKTPLYKRLYAAAIKRDKVEPGYLDKFKRATGTYHFDDIDEEMVLFTPHEWYRKTFAREEYWDDFMEVIPGDGYINYDDNQDSFLNPEFDEKENSAWIPKKGIKRYDNSKNYDKVINSPTLSALYKEVEKTIVESNEKMPNLRYHDNYLLPQITGSFYKKLSGAKLPENASKWQKIKNYVKYGAKGIGEDYFGRIEGDETDYGESIDDFMNRLNIDELGNILNNKSMSISNKVSGVMPDGRQLNIIPQYYTRKLKDPSLISYDLVGITCEYYNNACKFEQKSKIKDECESIVDMMENRKYNTKWHFLKPIKVLKSEDGSKNITTQKLISKQPKIGKLSNTYDAAKKFLEMNLYNLRGGDPVKFGNWNISKLGATFRAFAVAMNLGMSPVVAAVGYFTSILNHTIHAIVGQKYDYASAVSASWTVLLHALKNIGDIGNMASNDKLMCLAEHFNLSGQGKKKYKHSNRWRIVNAINNNWCFGFLTMFDYVAKSNIMVSTLMTYHLVDGLFTTKEDIKRNGWNKSKEEVKLLLLKWKSGKSLYSCLKADEEGNIICEEEFKSAYEKVEDVLHARIEKTAEAIDGMATETQKAAITTQFLGACVLMHRQYFPLMLLERLGHTVFDPDQQQYIHGEFRTLGRLFSLFLFKGWKETSTENISKQSIASGATIGAMSGSVFGPLGSIIGAGAGSIIGALKSSTFDKTFGISADYKQKYDELSGTYENMLNQNITPEQKQIVHREMEKDISKLYNDALNSITFNYHRRRIIAEFLMYKLLIIPIVSLIAGWADDDKDNLLAQLLAYIGHRTQWEFFTPYRLDDSLNNFKSTSAATGLIDRLQNFGGQLIYSMFPRGGLFDTFFNGNKKEEDNYILRGVYSKYPFAPFSGFDGKWDRFEQSLFKLLPVHNLYEQIYDSRQKDRYYTNQIMHLKD